MSNLRRVNSPQAYSFAVQLDCIAIRNLDPRPNPGKDAEFRALLKDHGPLLKRLGLITDRPTVIMQAKDGSYIEIKEWAAGASARAAHENPEVAALWDAMGKIADFPGLIGLEEAKEMFAHFKPVNF